MKSIILLAALLLTSQMQTRVEGQSRTEKTASAKLALAKKTSSKSLSLKWLKEIVEKYPATKAATEARQLLGISDKPKEPDRPNKDWRIWRSTPRRTLRVGGDPPIQVNNGRLVGGGPLKYLFVDVRTKLPANKSLQGLKIVDSGGKSVGKLLAIGLISSAGGQPKPEARLIFEGKTWVDLRGLSLEGLGRREPFTKTAARPSPKSPPKPAPKSKPKPPSKPPQPQSKPAPDTAGAPMAFQIVDRNRDSTISRDEARKTLKRDFAVVDRNDDDKISIAEWQAYSKQRKGLTKLLRQNDKNRDKKITRDEAPVKLRRNFAKVDADSDGFATIAEILEFRLSSSPSKKKKKKKMK